jgi:hypothetical protein
MPKYFYDLYTRTTVKVSLSNRSNLVSLSTASAVFLGLEKPDYAIVAEREIYLEELETELTLLKAKGFRTLEEWSLSVQGSFYGLPTKEVQGLSRSGIAKKVDVQDMTDKFLSAFHPAGYGSTVDVFETSLNDIVFWRASRASSCD